MLFKKFLGISVGRYLVVEDRLDMTGVMLCGTPHTGRGWIIGPIVAPPPHLAIAIRLGRLHLTVTAPDTETPAGAN